MNEINSNTAYQRVEDMIDYINPIIARWPTFYRKTLGERILSTLYDLSHLLVAAQIKSHKKATLTEADILKHDLEKLFLHALHTEYDSAKQGMPVKKKLIDAKRYGYWGERLAEIGKMIGAWIKIVKEREAKE